MNHLLFDHLRRRTGFLAGAALFAALLGWAIAGMPQTTHRQFYGLVGQVGVVTGAVTLLWDLQRGAGRAVALLPLSREQIARTWWLAAVAVPAALLSLSLVAGSLAHAVFSAKGGAQPEPLLEAILLLWLFSGAAFWLLLGMPLGPARDWRQRGAIAGWIFMLSAGSLINKVPPGSMLLLVLLALGVSATVLGWFFAPRLVGKCPRSGGADGEKAPARATLGDHHGRWGGMPYFVAQVTLRSLYITTLLLGGFGFLQLISSAGSVSTLPLSRLIPIIAAPAFPLSFLVGFQFLFPQLRSLRALPLSASGLATLMLGLTLLPIVIFAALVFAALAFSADDSFQQVFALMVLIYLSLGALALLGLAILGGGKRSLVFVTALFIGSQVASFPLMMSMHSPQARLPLGLAAAATALIVVFVQFTLPLALARSSRIYRPKAFGDMRFVWERQ